MSKPRNASDDPVDITVDASTDNPKDKGYHHYFEQDESYKLTFEVEIDSLLVDSINFVLWNLNDPVNPGLVELQPDVSVKEGKATITVGPHFVHLGPGPYCATLTASSPTAASSASKGARKNVGYAIYYYDTWKDSRRYPWPALS
jgi:hypothetical protein